MENLPGFIGYTFLAIVVAAMAFLFYALNHAAPEKKNFTPTATVTFLAVWLFVLSILTFNDFFLDFEVKPPRLIYALLPSVVAIVILFANKQSRAFLMKLPLTTLTYIHIIRVPVEIVLWWLSQEEVIPVELTFEGNNYDILSGISAPFAGVFLVGLRSKSRIGALIWNFLALGLLIYIVWQAIFATPVFFDPAVFSNPNIAVFYFPFILLPGFVVPVVLFSHLVSIYKLLGDNDMEDEY
ncbi:MAG: hypothetical protein JXQ90_05040 [Cyclobacteriaceae bacterium]